MGEIRVDVLLRVGLFPLEWLNEGRKALKVKSGSKRSVLDVLEMFSEKCEIAPVNYNYVSNGLHIAPKLFD